MEKIRLVEAHRDAEGRYRKIPAIKLVRELTGMGLKDSKSVVDHVEAGIPQVIEVNGDPEAAVHAFYDVDIKAGLAYEHSYYDGLMMALEAALGTGRNSEALTLVKMLKEAA